MTQPIDLSVKNLVKQFKEFTAVDSISFSVEKGKFFSILGPSGCGKTTLLRMISGFEEPTSGEIVIAGRNMAGVAPNKRPVNLVFQHLALFPLMSVAENVAFGLRRRKESKNDIPRKVEDILERVGLAGYGDKKPSQLSGGQRQRVALARCLVLEPAVLLLDEPLGALDLKLREQMKVELKTLQEQVGTTFVYITHDQSEALVMSDTVAVMNRGRFEQIDTPQALYRDPKTPFVAGFVGESSTWHGRVEEVTRDLATIRTSEGHLFRSRTGTTIRPGDEVTLYLRPEAMVINPEEGTDQLNLFDVQVQATLFDGGNSRLMTSPLNSDKEIFVGLPQTRQFDHIRKNDQITIGWHERSGICFPREGA